MTLSEIAQIHDGRCFTRSGRGIYRFRSWELEEWDKKSKEWKESSFSFAGNFTRTDWEFCPDPSQPEPTYDLTIGQALDAEIDGKKVEEWEGGDYRDSAVAFVMFYGGPSLRESRWRIVE